MSIKLENLTDRPVLLVLSSGESLRLSPGETSAELHEVEIQNNLKVDKLVKQRVIAVSASKTEPLPGDVSPPPAAESAASGPEAAEGKVVAAQPKKSKTGIQS